MKHLRIFWVYAALLLFSFQILSAQQVKLKVIETSDVHGSIFPYDFKNDRPANGSLAQVYTYVKQQRADKSQSVVLLDDGDILQGQPVVYYYNFVKSDTEHIVASVMNYMGYDVGTVGNHDIEPGHAVYDKIKKEFDFPWLAANAIDTKTGKPYFPPYHIIKRAGLKIAVLGMITPHIPEWLPEKIWSGIEFEDMIETAAKWVKIIKEKEKPDLLLGLFHSGVEATYGNQTADEPKNENASQLVAERVPGFDVVFVGHDHHGWNYTVKNKDGQVVTIVGTRNAATDIAIANIEMNYDKEKKEWDKKITGEIVETKNIEPDKDFLEKFHPQFEETKEFVSRPIGTFTKTISTRESMFGDSPFVDLIQRIQLDLTGADVSFSAPLSFNVEIKKGTVYVRDMFNLYKYENLLYTMELTGKEIKNYLEFSYSLWFNQMKDENDHLLNFKKDAQGNIVMSERNNTPLLANTYYNFDSAAGIDYVVDVSKPAGERITIKSFSDGRPFELDKKYKVAVNSYRGNGGGNHLIDGAKIPKEELSKRVINSTEKDLRYYLMNWIEKEKTITPKQFNNWTVVPASWYQKAKEKDYELLYKNALAE